MFFFNFKWDYGPWSFTCKWNPRLISNNHSEGTIGCSLQYVIIRAMASQITTLTIVYWIRRRLKKKKIKLRVIGLCGRNSPMNYPHKGPVTWLMTSSWTARIPHLSCTASSHRNNSVARLTARHRLHNTHLSHSLLIYLLIVTPALSKNDHHSDPRAIFTYFSYNRCLTKRQQFSKDTLGPHIQCCVFPPKQMVLLLNECNDIIISYFYV